MPVTLCTVVPPLIREAFTAHPACNGTFVDEAVTRPTFKGFPFAVRPHPAHAIKSVIGFMYICVKVDEGEVYRAPYPILTKLTALEKHPNLGTPARLHIYI